mmetsp:Transcript_13201/g.22389  ORF Transcript_13201/g.22389 Transcript_13201/m.22389 type:complete len:119 (-) Transcript_13201:67-423(-)
MRDPSRSSPVHFLNIEQLNSLIQHLMAEQGGQNAQNRRPTSQEVLEKLPLVEIEEKHCKKGENGNMELPCCSVCITDFQLSQKGLFLPCGHIFHPDCIKPWLQDHNTCPVCRTELPQN